MKKFTLILLLAAILLPACRYEEGPVISFRTPKNRLRGEWKLTEFRINNNDSTAVYKEKCNCEWIFDYEKTDFMGHLVNCKSNIEYVKFYYLLEENANYVRISFNYARVDTIPATLIEIAYLGPIRTSSYSTWEITKLKNDEFKIRTDFEGAKYQLSFEKTRELP